ncbi:MAG: NUDIX hydrolase [Microbacteriaceae bacterium]
MAYRNDWMTVREDVVAWPGGAETIYGVVEKPDYALVMPRERDGWWLVEQYRYTVERRVWEFPQGSWPTGADAAGSDAHGGTAEELAAAELREETGLIAGRLRHLGRLDEAYGFVRQGCHVFVATDLVAGEPSREATELDMVHRWFSDAQVAALIREGRMTETASLAALTLWSLDAQQDSSASG